jgi:hypothetical protein
VRRPTARGGTYIPGSKTEKKEKKTGRETVIVKAAGRSYADILKTVKAGINLQEVNVEITAIRKSKTDDLIIQLKGGRGKAESLRASIQGKITGVTAVRKQEMSVLHIRDLEEETLATEIQQSVMVALGEAQSDEIFITSLRPTHSGTKNATVKLPKQWAEQLARKKRIKIGWVSCRIQMRIEDHRCYKCWETGHTVKHCRGVDRSNLCFSCGEEGHKQNGCTETQSSTNAKKSKINGECPPETTVATNTGIVATPKCERYSLTRTAADQPRTY